MSKASPRGPRLHRQTLPAVIVPLPRTPTDLYEILGVARTVTTAALHPAFRKAAARTHPDVAGGSRQAYEAVRRAYEVLKDPKRRKLYDDTGIVRESKRDKTAGAIEVISEILNKIVATMAMQNIDVETVYLIETLKGEVATMRKTLAGEIKKAEAHAKRFKKIIERTSRKQGKNIIVEICAGKLHDVQKAIEDGHETDEMFEMAETIIAAHEFKVDAPQGFAGFTFTNVSAGSTR